MKSVHVIELVETQAKWWEEVCLQLGIQARISSKDGDKWQVVTVAEMGEREMAWELFCEQFKLKMELPVN